ncbi:MAG TPA: amidophosphoribosyltransferase, partial [Deinococcus radiodurans]|nr:amidophosphoribosyltransferase [Deinococcus radiodurans]
MIVVIPPPLHSGPMIDLLRVLLP